MKNFDSLVINDFVKTPLFEGIPLKVSKEMLRHFPIIELKSGEVLVREGKIDVCAYVLLHGRISLIKESEHNRVLAELGRGDAIGETSLLKEEPASSTAVAIRNSFVWKISPEIYENFSKAYPKEALKLLQNLIKLEKRDRFYSHRAFFLYVEDNQNAAKRIAKRLHDALSTFGLCRTIGKNEAIRYQDHLDEWLLNEHSKYEYSLYLSTKEDFSITHKMLAHSDRVIIYSKAELELSFDAEKIYLEANQLNKSIDLILEQKIETKLPKDTQKWLKQAPNVVWHHVKENAQEDFLRVARIISGHAIAFVLGGGGAKSLLYLGFYKAIKELGIPIDWVGGTCAGAMITTAIAMGLSLDDMIDRFKKHAPRNLMNAIDFTFPLVSLSSGRSMTRYITSAFGEVNLEDLWINNFCVATNLSHSKIELIDKGKAWRAIRASSGIPIFLHPISNDEGDLLVDGALVNNLPVDIMKKKIINGKVLAARHIQHSLRKLQLPAHRFGLFSYLKAYFAGQLQFYHLNIFKVLDRATMLASRNFADKNAKEADFCMNYEASHVGYFQYGEIDRLVETGYLEAMKQADEIKSLTVLQKKN